MKLKLTFEDDNQKKVLDYLEANVSDVLAFKINKGTKTLQDCWKYIVSEAKKLATSGCACIDDPVVYGWAIHFFEEDSIKAPETSGEKLCISSKAEKPKAAEPKKDSAKPENKIEKKVEKKEEQLPGQLSFEDIFGGAMA